ncbi:hypothetical protein GOBAR_DD05480 [Gossypium barbadense]|nr:hypothetical protein GOBAR_DD05480 [Gossypium barbadense]
MKLLLLLFGSNSNTKSKAVPFMVFVLVLTGMVEQGEGTTCHSTFLSALVQLIPCRAAVAPFSRIPPSETCCNAIKLPQKCTANFEPCILPFPSPSLQSLDIFFPCIFQQSNKSFF